VDIINLAEWGRPAFSIPTLVVLEAFGYAFTFDDGGEGWARQEWHERFLATLPRLERLVLFAQGPEAFCESNDESMTAASVRTMLTERLPRAAEEAGRRLDVVVEHVPLEVQRSSGLPTSTMLARCGWASRTQSSWYKPWIHVAFEEGGGRRA
jgi:hypothetical protein